MVRITLACIALVAGGCGQPPDRTVKPRLAASIFPLYDLVRRVAGDRFDVLLVLPPGRFEHAYDPTPKQVARLEGAKLDFVIGLDLDGWAEAVMKGAGSVGKIVRIGDHVKTIPISAAPIGEVHGDADDTPGAPDPHVWLDPDRMISVVDTIAGELAAVDPAGKDTFASNAETVKASLRALDATIAGRAKAWTKHTIVTFHGSMTYYARRYGVVIAAVIEPLAGKQPTAAYIVEVLAAIQRTQATALFSEPQLDRAPAETIASEAKIPLGELDPVGGVAGRDSYEALLAWDTDQLEKALR